jgi:hypothetical protein
MNLCRAGALKTVASELDLAAVKEIRCTKGSSEPADKHTFFYGNGSANSHSGTGFVHNRIR